MNIATGTRIEVCQGYAPENGRIMRWLKSNGPRIVGYHKVRFDADGAVLLVHENAIRVIDNRTA